MSLCMKYPFMSDQGRQGSQLQQLMIKFLSLSAQAHIISRKNIKFFWSPVVCPSVCKLLTFLTYFDLLHEISKQGKKGVSLQKSLLNDQCTRNLNIHTEYTLCIYSKDSKL